jgi:Uma2 family endonuclease
MAAMKAVDPRVTYAELEQWPDDGRRYELYGGEVIVVPAPLPIHQVVALRVYDRLKQYADLTGGLTLCAPLDVVFSEYDVLQPDLVFFDRDRRGRINLHSAIRVVPNLVVEVLSRSTAARDRGRKRDVFARYGVPEYWIVDPVVCTFEILRNDATRFRQIATFEENGTVTAATLADLTFSLETVFLV